MWPWEAAPAGLDQATWDHLVNIYFMVFLSLVVTCLFAYLYSMLDPTVYAGDRPWVLANLGAILVGFTIAFTADPSGQSNNGRFFLLLALAVCMGIDAQLWRWKNRQKFPTYQYRDGLTFALICSLINFGCMAALTILNPGTNQDNVFLISFILSIILGLLSFSGGMLAIIGIGNHHIRYWSRVARHLVVAAWSSLYFFLSNLSIITEFEKEAGNKDSVFMAMALYLLITVGYWSYYRLHRRMSI